VTEVGTFKSQGDKGCTISLTHCGASGAYIPGPDDEEEPTARVACDTTKHGQQ
jgi:hypothetical protein